MSKKKQQIDKEILAKINELLRSVDRKKVPDHVRDLVIMLQTATNEWAPIKKYLVNVEAEGTLRGQILVNARSHEEAMDIAKKADVDDIDWDIDWNIDWHDPIDAECEDDISLPLMTEEID